MNVAVRCYVDNGDKEEHKEYERYFNPNLVLVIDTETTVDTYQNMLFGYCSVWENDMQARAMLIYDADLNEQQLEMLRERAEKHKAELMTKEEFVYLFYHYVFKRRAVCVNFNIPFDIARLALTVGTSSKDENSFSFKLSPSIYYPRITVKHIDSKSSFIGFTKPLSRNRKKIHKYAGTFVDLRTLSFALTNEPYSLETACAKFNKTYKSMAK
jgi:hypothetical protein